MGNIPSIILASSSSEVDNEKIVQKIEEAVQKKHLRLSNLGLTRVPKILVSEEVKKDLNESLKSLDIHANPLQYFPTLDLPNLTTLNLWGNNMAAEMFAPYTNYSRRGIQGKLKSRNRRAQPPKLQTNEFTEDREHLENGAFSTLPKLDCLDLGYNQLNRIPLSVKKCTKLTQLTLSGNFLQSSCLCVIKDLSELTLLDLDLNELREIPDACLSAKPKLFSLTMRGNRITTVPESLHLLNSLQTLNLADNNLDVVENGSFAGLTQLKKLYLFNNQLTSIPEDFFRDLKGLVTLFLQCNKLKQLPPFNGLDSLRELNLSHNSLTLLPSLKSLPSITQLNISHNQLVELPNSIHLAHQLYSLDVSFNSLSYLPLSMIKLTQLTQLNLSGNRFTSGGKFVFSPDTDISDHIQTEGIQPVWTIRSLTNLQVPLNQLSDIPADALKFLTNLKILNLAFNQLTTENIPKFESVNQTPGDAQSSEGNTNNILSIENLFLNGNQLDSFPLQQLLPLQNSLQVLALEANNIHQIPEKIHLFTNLTRLSISAPYSSQSESQSKSTDKLCKYLAGLPLSRFYVGSYFEGTLDDLGFKDCEDANHIFPKLSHSDFSSFSAFPHFSCAIEKMGALNVTSYGTALCTGTSHDLEDCIHFRSLSLPPCGTSFVDYIALFDGHGGREVCLFVQQYLAPVIESYLKQTILEQKVTFSDTPQNCNLIGQALINAYIETNKALKQTLISANLFDKHVGCTAVTLILTEKMIFSANVGDSRVVLATFSPPRSSRSVDTGNETKIMTTSYLRAKRISFDHKPNVREERRRIRQNGGVLVQSLSGTCSYRLTQPSGGPNLAVSRSFGDFHLIPSMSVHPDIFCHAVVPSDQFLVISSDGLWDVLTDKMCIDLVAKLIYEFHVLQSLPLKKACEIAASHLRDLVFSLGSNDDLSVIIVPLNWNYDHCMEAYYKTEDSPKLSTSSPSGKKKKRKKKE